MIRKNLQQIPSKTRAKLIIILKICKFLCRKMQCRERVGNLFEKNVPPVICSSQIRGYVLQRKCLNEGLIFRPL